MELNLEEALEAPVALSHRLEIPLGRLERPEILSLDEVQVEGILRRAAPGFALTARIRLSGTSSCARCLLPVPFRSDAETTWNFTPAAGVPGEEEVELSTDELDAVPYLVPRVELDPLIEEQIQLELPLKALCRPDCRGLCPECGCDRNTATCTCQEPSDERWGALRRVPASRS